MFLLSNKNGDDKMNLHVISIRGEKRWEVVFKENDRWQCGIYVPENTSLDDITFLEKHNAPELFVLVRGNIVLVLMDDEGNIKEVNMEEDKIYIVNTWHNAYRPNNCEGVALVIERPDITTEYKSLNT